MYSVPSTNKVTTEYISVNLEILRFTAKHEPYGICATSLVAEVKSHTTRELQVSAPAWFLLVAPSPGSLTLTQAHTLACQSASLPFSVDLSPFRVSGSLSARPPTDHLRPRHLSHFSRPDQSTLFSLSLAISYGSFMLASLSRLHHPDRKSTRLNSSHG